MKASSVVRPHGDSAGLQVYKEAAALSPSPQRENGLAAPHRLLLGLLPGAAAGKSFR